MSQFVTGFVQLLEHFPSHHIQLQFEHLVPEHTVAGATVVIGTDVVVVVVHILEDCCEYAEHAPFFQTQVCTDKQSAHDNEEQ